MQIVIDIPNDDYYDILQYAELKVNTEFENLMIVAIKNGTPLPKGHGRLIDADEFHRTLEDIPIRDTDKWFNWLQKACIRLAKASTILEAESEE